MNRVTVQKSVIFVFFLGLLACTPDKSKQQEDQWRLSPPEIVMPSTVDGERGRLKVGEASQKELPLTAELSFAGITPDVIFEIDSLCIHHGTNFEETFRIQAPQSFQLGAIVPSQALLSANQGPIECSFDFSAINQHRSRHHFLIPGVKLFDQSKYGDMVVSKKLERISPAESSENKTIVAVDELDQIAIDSEVRSGVAELACADFTSRVQFNSVDSIDWKQLAYKQPIEVLEKVLAKFRQPCRFALKDHSGLRAEISAGFTLLYPAPALEILAQTPTFDGPPGQKIRDISILNLDISNPTNIDQFLELQSTSADPRMVWTHAQNFQKQNENSNFYYWFNIHRTAEISYTVSGSEQVITSGSKTFFVIKAKSAIKVSVNAHSYFGTFAASNTKHSGYLLLLPQPIRLKRLEVSGDFKTAIEENSFQVSDEISIFKLAPHHLNETQVYIPHAKVNRDWMYVARNLTERAFPPSGD